MPFSGRKSRFFIEKRPKTARKRPFRTLFRLRGPLRLVSDPKTVSRQGRQGREEAFEGPRAAWRPLRSLRENFIEKRPQTARKRPFRTIFHLCGPLRLVSDPETVSRQGRQGRGEAFAGSPAAWRPWRTLRENFMDNHGLRPGNDDFGSVVDPETVSRQGRQGRGEAFEGPRAAWRPLRSLRENFSGK